MRTARAVALLLLAAGLPLAGCKKQETKVEDPVPGLVEQLQSMDEEKSGAARLELLKLGEPAVPALAGLLRNPDARIRKTALTTLWGLGTRSAPALPDVLVQLSDPDPELRLAAVMVVEVNGAGAAEAVPTLIRLLKDQNVEVRQRAAVALGAIGPLASAALPALGQAARFDPVRPQAELAIKRIQGGAR
jgi:HEAT repeat protein